MMCTRVAPLALTLSLVAVCSVSARADLPKPSSLVPQPLTPQPAQSFSLIGNEKIPGIGGTSCMSAPANHTVTLGDLTKLEGTKPAWQGTMASPVTIAPQPFFYGSSLCSKLWVTDFQVSNAMKVSKNNVASSSGPFTPWFFVGDHDRKGAYVANDSLSTDQLLDQASRDACKTAPNAGQCESTKAADICSRLFTVTYQGWKKAGETAFKTVRTSMIGYIMDGYACHPSSRFSYEVFQADPIAEPVDSLPLVPARTDTYRVVAGAFLFSKTITNYQTSQYVSSNDFGKSSADAQWIFNPKQYSPSSNPIVSQFPVKALVRPY